MGAKRMVELGLLTFAAACGEAPELGPEDLGRTSASLEVTSPATDIGVDDMVFRRVETALTIECPPGMPFMCRAENATGWACSETACAPSCEKIGCPGGWQCIDCGAGPECAPPSHACE